LAHAVAIKKTFIIGGNTNWRLIQTPYRIVRLICVGLQGRLRAPTSTRATRIQFSNHNLNKSRGSEVECLITFLTIMKKILFALSMLALVVSALPQTTRADVSVDFFYNNLSGGNWIDVEGYGYGWQPDAAVSDPNWRPYSDGYWAYTDYGWTWISYEDFGWATYHYGRWGNLGDYGWVWFPGSDLDWGPAWVSWRTGGDNIGWAPLPPRGAGVVYEGQPIGARVDIEYDIGPEYYNFCDVRFIGEPVLRDRIFPPAQNVTYITNTVNVTNITVQNNVVYNYGPDINVVNSYSTRPIQRLTVERQSAADLAAAAKTGALTKVQGNKLVVAAPARLAKAPATVAPPAVKAKVAQPKIERGWSGVQNKAELEQKIKSENPKNIPPPTRAAAREGASPVPAAGGSPAVGEAKPPVSPGPQGKPGRMPPGAATSQGGVSPSQFERGKPPPGGRPPIGAKPTPPGRQPGASPAPFEREKPTTGARPRLGESAPPAGQSPAPFERGQRPRRPGATPPQHEQGQPPARRPGESPAPGGGAENNPPGRGRGAERAPTGARAGAGANDHRGGAEQRTPPEARHPGGQPPQAGPSGETRAARERGQGASGQSGGQPPRGGGQATGEQRGQRQPEQAPNQPERGGKKPERGTPPPGPQ
jgi:hypothetical protein